jgi:hypothetical protein
MIAFYGDIIAHRDLEGSGTLAGSPYVFGQAEGGDVISDYGSPCTLISSGTATRVRYVGREARCRA